MTARRRMACSRRLSGMNDDRDARTQAERKPAPPSMAPSATDPPRRPQSVATLGIGVAALLWPRLSPSAPGAMTRRTTRVDGRCAERQRDFVPERCAPPRSGRATRHVVVTLPGTTSAFATANIFARASGYIVKRNVDIGDRVKAGQLLAEITAPELDHQIAQAQATLGQTQATLRQAAGQCGSRQGHLAARQAAGRRRAG